jgi:23S rRNA (guanosine2251-2'-O)-methyltransferase
MNLLQIESESAIEHILAYRPERIKSITLFHSGHNSRLERIDQLARSLKIAVHKDAKERGKTITATLLPYEYADWKAFKSSLKERALVLALDHLQDPQNFGSLCRTAEALGVDGVIIPKDRSVTVSPGVYHASVGAVETLPIVMVPNLNEALRQLKEAGCWIVGTAISPDAHSLEDTPDFEKKVLVLGSELEGLSDQTQKLCDWLIQIPMRGKVQSLNVGVSGGILLYELLNR